jgi:glutaredoxin
VTPVHLRREDALLYTRTGCPLCYVLCRAARRAARRHGVPLAVIDVDADPLLRARYGDEVPVLELPGEPPLRGRAGAREIDAAFRRVAGRHGASRGPTDPPPGGWLRRILAAAAGRFAR